MKVTQGKSRTRVRYDCYGEEHHRHRVTCYLQDEKLVQTDIAPISSLRALVERAKRLTQREGTKNAEG